MRYDHIATGIFINRPNRFIAICEITDPDDGKTSVCRCHVKNTGHCRKLLMKVVLIIGVLMHTSFSYCISLILCYIP